MDHKKKSVSNLYKWVSPGIFVKRWLITSLLGVLLTLLGFAIWVKLTPINRLIEFLINFLDTFTSVVPNYITGPVAILLGLYLLYWGQHRTFRSIKDAFQLDSQQELVDVLWDHHRLNRGLKIVALGGGTGLSTMLRGLKEYSSNITAIVTVADDGGSSGVLRRELGALPPGDIRNCIAALANEERLLTELFQYRFNSGEGLKGHSFGNLFLTAMTDITKDPEMAIHASSQVLAIKGQVLPATLDNVTLWAKFDDGMVVEGESKIPERGGKIIEFGCKPSSPRALPSVLTAIAQAEFIVMGPGSLYTSVIPNLLVPEIREAILSSSAPKIYVCNIMTQPGETDGYTVADHIRTIDEVCGGKLFDAVLVQGRPPSPSALRKYADEWSHPVFLDRQEVINLGRRIIISNVMSEHPETHVIRHNPRFLARALMRWLRKKH